MNTWAPLRGLVREGAGIIIINFIILNNGTIIVLRNALANNILSPK